MTNMTKREKILTAIGAFIFLGAFVFAMYANRPVTSPALGAAGQLYRNQFSIVTIATTTVVGTTPVQVLASTTANLAYLSIINSSSSNVSCFPVDIGFNSNETTTGLTIGGGWYLVANGGVISLDSVAIYAGTVDCFTGSGTTTLGIVRQ